MKSFVKISLRSIKDNISRFLSILTIVALGTGFLSGLLATTPDMKKTTGDYLENQKLYDFYIQSNMGITEQDKRAISNLKGVESCMPVYQKDLMFKDSRGKMLESRIIYLKDIGRLNINIPKINRGRLPKHEDEVFLTVLNEYGYKSRLGARFKDSDGRTYKVVGEGRLPQCISSKGEITNIGSGKISLYMYKRDGKKRKIYAGIYVRSRMNRRADLFSEKYKDSAIRMQKKIKRLGISRSRIRRAEIIENAIKNLDEKRNSVNKRKNLAENKILNAEKKLNAAKGKLKRSGTQLGKQKLRLEKATRLLGNRERQLLLIKKQNKIEQLKEMYLSGATLSEQQLGALRSYEIAVKKVEYSKKRLLQSKNKIVVADKKIKKAEAVLKKKAGLIRLKKQKINSYFKEAELKLDDAEDRINRIKKAKWHIWGREDNLGYMSYKSDVEKVAAIAKIFPVFFFLVAVLVALTTMTRMIEEERQHIGILKAIGYSNSGIRGYYLSYGITAAVIGAILGQGIGLVLFPKTIGSTYSMIYNVPEVEASFVWEIALAVSVVTILGIAMAIVLSCREELSEKPAALLLPKAPPPGKRILLEKIGFVWKRMSFSRKVTMRNIFRYKKRFLMTVLGVAGCYALLIVGFGIRDSFSDIVETQYGDLHRYDISLKMKRSADDFEKNNKILIANGSFLISNASIKKRDGKKKDIKIIVPKESAKIDNYILLRTSDGKKKLSLGKSGAIISEKIAENLRIKKDDKIRLLFENIEGRVKIGGKCENYIDDIIYMDETTFHRAFSKRPVFNTVLAKLNSARYDKEKILTILNKNRNVEYIMDVATLKDQMNDSMRSINYVVLVLIISAGVLAIIVLYNLTNVNICERKKEIATVKVLGFYEKEAENYIFKEMHVLTALGILVGIPLGTWLHSFMLDTIETGDISLGRDIGIQSYIYAVFITIFFAAVVNRIMRRVIRKIDMVESMKANE